MHNNMDTLSYFNIIINMILWKLSFMGLLRKRKIPSCLVQKVRFLHISLIRVCNVFSKWNDSTRNGSARQRIRKMLEKSVELFVYSERDTKCKRDSSRISHLWRRIFPVDSSIL